MNCPNCNRELTSISSEHLGWGAGPGSTSSGDKLCPTCKQGHIHYENDDIPGFRDHWSSNCCKCDANHGWVI